MYRLDDINTITPDGTSLIKLVSDYIREKNLNFIISRGHCVNLCQADLSQKELAACMDEYSACDFSMVSCPNLNPSPPFMAAGTDADTKTARVEFLIDLTQEAQGGRASKFYSKILGALSTQFFAACPKILRLYFPFTLEDTVGRGLGLENQGSGTFIVKG